MEISLAHQGAEKGTVLAEVKTEGDEGIDRIENGEADVPGRRKEGAAEESGIIHQIQGVRVIEGPVEFDHRPGIPPRPPEMKMMLFKIGVGKKPRLRSETGPGERLFGRGDLLARDQKIEVVKWPQVGLFIRRQPEGRAAQDDHVQTPGPEPLGEVSGDLEVKGGRLDDPPVTVLQGCPRPGRDRVQKLEAVESVEEKAVEAVGAGDAEEEAPVKTG
jgi:hypothetical protein